MPKLTIGMPTYKDFDGVYFTIQSLRLFHDLEDTEILVVDNFGDEHTEKFVKSAGGRYVVWTDVNGSAVTKNKVFEEAQGEWVLCCDSHVFFPPGVIARLKEYQRQHPDSRDLLQGPLLYDDLRNLATHWDPIWRGQMWGVWATDPRGKDPDAEPFDIPMQGMGAFSCRKDAWVGYNPTFRGFGGEQGYIHEKFRQAGARTLCLPFFRWVHRFGRPAGAPYPLYLRDKVRNYIIGHIELGLDIAPIIEHFSEHTSEAMLQSIIDDAMQVGVSWVPPTPEPVVAAPPRPAPSRPAPPRPATEKTRQPEPVGQRRG